MQEEMISRFIEYLEGMQVYCKVLETYYKKEELDDFDCWYLELYHSFGRFLLNDLENQNSPLMQLAKNYQEFVVDYKESLLFRCIEALNRGYSRQQVYNEGKKDVYLKYIKTNYDFNAEELFETMNEEQFSDFEANVFNDLYIKKVIDKMTNCYK